MLEGCCQAFCYWLKVPRGGHPVAPLSILILRAKARTDKLLKLGAVSSAWMARRFLRSIGVPLYPCCMALHS
jgi:hypothetical protein